jgi:hypothetical protein
MKFCIISDLHCRYLQNPNEKIDTFLISNRPRIPVSRHPVAAFLQLVDKERITADVLICPGDLGDKADEQGIISSWGFLEEIKLKIDAKILIGVPGNHDINSRRNDQKEPFQFIKSFHPDFPLKDDISRTSFWEKAFCFHQHDDVLYLLFNSVHDHSNEENAKYSCIKPEILEQMRATYDSKTEYRDVPYKIALLHHHPIHHSDINNWRGSDIVDKGDNLVSLLNELGFQIMIHGHKHQPRVVEYNSFPILACGSFSSFANLNGTGISNMFHLLELQPSSRKGTISSWEYDVLNGWQQNLNKQFPPKIGFGTSISIPELANKVDEIFSSHSRKTMLYEFILEEIPELQYIIPEKLIQLNNLLKNSYKIRVTPEFPLEPNKVSNFLS